MPGRRSKAETTSTMLLASLLANLQLKRKCWCMQLLKQFILFPDDSDSSQKTVSRYDRLIFSDQEIHTMYKKLETKLIQRQLWAFLNLKYNRYVKAIALMERPIESLNQKKQVQHKGYSFTKIKVYSEFKSQQQRIQHQTEITLQNINSPAKIQKESKNVNPNYSEEFQISIDIQYITKYGKKPSRSRSPYRLSRNIQYQPRILQTHNRKVDPQPYRPRQISHTQPRVNTISYPISQIHPSQPPKSQAEHPQPPTTNNTSYPISQIHPSQPPKSQPEHPQPPIATRSHQMHKQDEDDRRRGRSRSGSIAKYEYQLDGSKRLTVNCNSRPVNIRVVSSESLIDQAPHKVTRTPPKDMKYQPYSKAQKEQLIKRQKLRLQYKNNQPSNTDQRARLTSSKISRGLNEENNQNCTLAHGTFNNPSAIPSLSSTKKISRLRSSSRSKNNQYLQHLNS